MKLHQATASREDTGTGQVSPQSSKHPHPKQKGSSSAHTDAPGNARNQEACLQAGAEGSCSETREKFRQENPLHPRVPHSCEHPLGAGTCHNPESCNQLINDAEHFHRVSILALQTLLRSGSALFHQSNRRKRVMWLPKVPLPSVPSCHGWQGRRRSHLRGSNHHHTAKTLL